MRDLRLMIGAGQVEEVAAVGAYLRIKSASVPLLIEIENGKSRFEIAKGGSVNLTPFTRFSVSHSSPTDQAIVIAVGDDGEEQTEGVMTGEVAITNLPSVQTPNIAQVQRTVTPTSAQLLGQRHSRSFLVIQNEHPFGSIYIRLHGTGVSVSEGLRLGPGQRFEMTGGIAPRLEIYAIGDMLSNPNVVVMEGYY